MDRMLFTSISDSPVFSTKLRTFYGFSDSEFYLLDVVIVTAAAATEPGRYPNCYLRIGNGCS